MASPTLNANQIALLRHWQQRGVDPARFKYGGDTNEGGATGGGGSSKGSSKGTAGGSGGSGGSMHQSAISQASKGSSKPASGGAGRLSDAAADHVTAKSYGLSDREYQSAVTGLRDRVEDSRDMGEGPLNTLGKAILGLGGYYEADPSLSQKNAARAWAQSIADAKAGVTREMDESADRMIDPFQVGANIIGAVTPVPAGSLYSIGTALFGRPDFGQISLGPSGPDVPTSGGVTTARPGAPGDPNDPRGQVSRDIRGTLLSQLNVAPTTASALAQSAGQTPVPPPPTSQTDPSVDAQGYGVTIPYPYDPLHYAEAGPEWRFYSKAPQFPKLPVIKVASGGAIGDYAPGGGVYGPGDGQDDKIPAMLSNNEHVIDAATVALAGRGDSDAGHRVIEQWKRDLRKKAGMKNPNKAPLMKGISALKVT